MKPACSLCRPSVDIYPRHCHASRHCLSHLLPCARLFPAPFFLLPAGNSQLDAAALQHLQQLTLLSGLTVSSSSLNNQDLSAICSALPQLRHLDAGNNRITKADPLTALVSLTSLVLSRNPLQLNCSKVLAGMPLQSLVLFSAAPARATSHLSGGALTQQLTSLTLGADPSLFPEGTDESLQLAKTRTVGALFGALAEAGRLRMLSVPCTGLGDAQAKLLHKLGSSLQTLNVRCGRSLQEGPGVCQVSQGLAVAAAFLRWPMGCFVNLNTTLQHPKCLLRLLVCLHMCVRAVLRRCCAGCGCWRGCVLLQLQLLEPSRPQSAAGAAPPGATGAAGYAA